MTPEDECEKLRQATLAELSAQSVGQAGDTPGESYEIVSTVLGPREVPLQDSTLESLAAVLVSRVKRDIEARSAGRTLVRINQSKCDWSDHADCEVDQGVTASAFVTGDRCYRIVLDVVVT